MLQIKEIVNAVFSSQTYIIFKEGNDKAWLVDIGDIEPVISLCEKRELSIEGVFLTHAHFDHIYGLPALLQHFPACIVYTNEFGKKALASEKLNMSKYHETPIAYEGENVVAIKEGEEFVLFENEPLMRLYETPGHNPSCITMVLGDYVFTGDAYIPGLGVNTQLPHANKEQSKSSLERIVRLADGKTIFCGHQVKEDKLN